MTLIELLVVIAIIGILTAVLVPAVSRVRQQARNVININNQKQVVIGVVGYEMDNNRFPPSVATIGSRNENWHWRTPMTIVTYPELYPLHYRSMSSYLGDYIDNGRTMFCPNGPKEYPYMQQAWRARENWDNPQYPGPKDILVGNYCFYWNYIGSLDNGGKVFRGPRNSSDGGRRRSKLVVSDCLDYDVDGGDVYRSCQKFYQAGVEPRLAGSTAMWHRLKADENTTLDSIKIKLNAGYADGRVESYSTLETVKMNVAWSADGTNPSPTDGDIFIPLSGRY